MKKLIVVLISTLLTAPINTALAGDSAQNRRMSAISSASWAVAAVAEGQAPTFQPLMLTWNVSGGTAYQYFSFSNLGSTTANNFLVIVTQSTSIKNGNVSDVFFERCLNGTWNIAANTCSGTVILIGKATDQVFTFTNASLSAGTGISMRARTPPNNRNAYVTSISTSISRLDVRQSIITHS